MRVTVLLLVVALSVSLAMPAFAQSDGAALYKTKCAACHGPAGEGKIGPKLVGTTLSVDQIVDLITKGVEGKKLPHKKSFTGVSTDDAKAVADFVKNLK